MSDIVYLLGDQVRQAWTVLDLSSNPLTGVTTPAGITFTLHRDNGTAIVAAVESITWTEIGVSGTYYISFTPANLGVYTLQLKELHVSSLGRTWAFEYAILAAGSVFLPSYSNAFCSESDIERWTGTTIDTTTNPTSTSAAAFAEERAALLMAIMASLGAMATTPLTVSVGSRLEDLLRRANAIGAALDYTVAQQFSKSPSLSDRVTYFQTLWDQTVYGELINGKMIGGIVTEVKNLFSLSTDHIISGDTQARTPDVAMELPIGIGMGSLF